MSAPKISKKTGKEIKPTTYISHPSRGTLSLWIKKSPWKIYKDSVGRVYGERVDETFESFYQEKAWFVHLPTTPSDAASNTVVEFPIVSDRIQIVNIKTKKEITISVVTYPERTKMNAKTASINVLIF